MGFHYTGKYTSGLLSKYDVYKAIQECISRIEKNQADAAMLRWFGDSSNNFKKDLKTKLNKMRSRINLIQINVGFESMKERDVDTNASAFPGAVTSLNPTSNRGGQHVFLDLNFKNLPNYLPLSGGLIDASDYHQSQFNTFAHELSHLILNTDDEELNNGDEAYGTEQALQLVGENVAKAKNNAENWGIFIEACGYRKTS